MSAPCIIIASLPSFCQNYQNWWKFDKVITKTICRVFLRYGTSIQTKCIASKVMQNGRTSYCLPVPYGWVNGPTLQQGVARNAEVCFETFRKIALWNSLLCPALPCPARGRNRKLMTWVHNYTVSQKVDHPNGGDNLIYANISCLEQWSVSGIVTQQVMKISEVLTVSEFS